MDPDTRNRPMNTPSAVPFPGASRIHVALGATDLERSARFYEVLLGAPPTKRRPGYVKFEPSDPSVNLTLNQVGPREPAPRGVSHFGVQVSSTDDVRDAVRRLSEAGLATDVEEGTTCCYAVQDKVWVTDPDGNRWEVFVVTAADADQRRDPASDCCAPDAADTAAAGCCTPLASLPWTSPRAT
jgi:catechol 2,3-dioxygenase-like lactoylglutathione lyase family enzyme